MKKVILALAAGLTTSVASYAVPASSSSDVSLPNLTPGYSVNVSGMYVKTIGTAVASGASSIIVGDTTVNNVNLLNPEYNWGFGLGAAYVFPNTSNDVQIHWDHLDTGHTSLVDDSAAPTRRTADQAYKYNAVDLNTGQYVNFGDRLSTRFSVGLRYVRLKQNINTTSGDVSGGAYSITRSTSYNSKLNGLGPRLGIDSTYYIANNFSAVGGIGMSLLVSNTDANSNRYAAGSYTSYIVNDLKRVIPEVDGKLGLSYTRAVNSQSTLTAELGYKAAYYNDAIVFVNTDGTFGNTNFGYYGPYLNLSYKF